MRLVTLWLWGQELALRDGSRRARRACGLLWRAETLQPSLVTLPDLLPRLNSPVGSHGRRDSWWGHRRPTLSCRRLRHTRAVNDGRGEWLIIQAQHLAQDVTGEHVHGNALSLIAHLELEQRSDLLQCRVIRRFAASILHAREDHTALWFRAASSAPRGAREPGTAEPKRLDDKAEAGGVGSARPHIGAPPQEDTTVKNMCRQTLT